MSMIGKWTTFANPEDNDYSHDGQITEAIGTERFLIRLRNVWTGVFADIFHRRSDRGFLFRDRSRAEYFSGMVRRTGNAKNTQV
jgi:hypothetical protein